MTDRINYISVRWECDVTSAASMLLLTLSLWVCESVTEMAHSAIVCVCLSICLSVCRPVCMHMCVWSVQVLCGDASVSTNDGSLWEAIQVHLRSALWCVTYLSRSSRWWRQRQLSSAQPPEPAHRTFVLPRSVPGHTSITHLQLHLAYSSSRG